MTFEVSADSYASRVLDCLSAESVCFHQPVLGRFARRRCDADINGIPGTLNRGFSDRVHQWKTYSNVHTGRGFDFSIPQYLFQEGICIGICLSRPVVSMTLL